MNLPAENWYVYYPAPSAPGLALPLLRVMQEQLAARSGIAARLEERVESGTATWMEVYEGVKDPEGFAANLKAAVMANGLAGVTLARRIERFRPL